MSNITILLAASLCLGRLYSVGPAGEYERIIECPTFDLQAGDSIVVQYSEEPYRDKFLFHGSGTAEEPVVLLGLPDSLGRKPVIDGQDAETSLEYGYWNEIRQVVLVGLYSPLFSDYIVIDGFEIRNGNDRHYFTDDHQERQQYAENACAIRAEYCGHLTIRNCDLHHCANGFQNGTTDSTQKVLIEFCNIYHNGADQDSTRYLEHNIYLSGKGVRATIQFCRFGELLNDGQQLKSRAELNVIRYNRIEGGRNSQLDLVDANDDELIADAYVYGNVIIKPEATNNSRMIHFGGDQEGSRRNGTLHFFNNTCIINSTRNYGTRRIFEISRDDARVIADNNIFFSRDNAYAVWNVLPNISGANNWLSNVITRSEVFDNSITGELPGFIDDEAGDYHLAEGSPCIDVVESFEFPDDYPLEWEFDPDSGRVGREINGGLLDLGAFEFRSGNMVREDEPPIADVFPLVSVYPNPFNSKISIQFNAGRGEGLPLRAAVFDRQGRLAGEIYKTASMKGRMRIVWDAGSLPAGVYAIRLDSPAGSTTKKLVVVK